MEEETIKKEPKIALYSENNGLSHYIRLIDEIKLLIKNNKSLILAMEINPLQKNYLLKEIEKKLPKAKVQTIKDYNQKVRLIIVKLNT